MTELMADYTRDVWERYIRATADRRAGRALDRTAKVELKGLLRRPYSGIDPTTMTEARQVLARAIDELMTQGLMGGPTPADADSAYWAENALEWDLFKTNLKAVEVWPILESGHAARDVLEVGVRCVALGYRGDRSGAELRDGIAQLAFQVETARRTARTLELAEERPPAQAGALAGRGRLVPRVCAVLSGLLTNAAGGTPLEREWRRARAYFRAFKVDLRDTRLIVRLGERAPADADKKLVGLAHPNSTVQSLPIDNPGLPVAVTACSQTTYLTWDGAAAVVEDEAQRLAQAALAADDEPYATVGAFRVKAAIASGRPRAAGLESLCRTIAASRHPKPGVNGVVLPIDWNDLDDEDAAKGRALELAADFASVRAGFGLSPPFVVLVEGLEADPGFVAFAEGLPSQGRVGAGTSWPRSIDAAAVEGVVRDCLARAKANVDRQIDDRFRRELADGTPAVGLALTAERILAFEKRLHDRLPTLQRLVVRVAAAAHAADPGGLLRLSGVYFAGRGTPQHAAALRKANEDRNHVAWTAAAVRSDRRWHWVARVGNAACLTAAGVAAASVAWAAS